MTSKHIIYTGPFSFPDGGAAARRIFFNCLSLMDSGYKVTIASGQVPEDGKKTQKYRDIDVVSLSERDSEHLPRHLKHLSYFKMGKATVEWLDGLEKKPHAIILYSGYSPYLLRLLKWCRQNQVELVFDAVEWYDPPNILQALTPYYLNIEYAMRFLIPRVGRVLAISRYLDNYFRGRGCETALVPPTIDTRQSLVDYSYERRAFLKLVYAGSPGHKDSLHCVICAVSKLISKGLDVQLHIAGLDDEQLLSYAKLYKVAHMLSENIIAHGFLAHGQASRLVAQSDFSVFGQTNKEIFNRWFFDKICRKLFLWNACDSKSNK